MLITLGLGSATGLYSGLVSVVRDHLPSLDNTITTFAVLVVGFSSSIVYITPGGQQILHLVDFFGGSFVIFVLAILEVIAGMVMCCTIPLHPVILSRECA